ATAAVARQWVDAAAGIKGLPADSTLLGEEWLSGPYSVITACEALAASLQALQEGRSPVDGFTISAAPGGRSAVEVLPHSAFDQLLLSGFSAQ
ncbi:aldehyde dehydrogenase family protein, partial [Mycobacterium kansasii]